MLERDVLTLCFRQDMIVRMWREHTRGHVPTVQWLQRSRRSMPDGWVVGNAATTWVHEVSRSVSCNRCFIGRGMEWRQREILVTCLCLSRMRRWPSGIVGMFLLADVVVL